MSPTILRASVLGPEKERLPSCPPWLLQELEVDDGDTFCPDDKLDEGLLFVLTALPDILELQYGSIRLPWASHFLLAAAIAEAAAAVMNCIINADPS
jgi:hypothetical protein